MQVVLLGATCESMTRVVEDAGYLAPQPCMQDRNATFNLFVWVAGREQGSLSAAVRYIDASDARTLQESLSRVLPVKAGGLVFLPSFPNSNCKPLIPSLFYLVLACCFFAYFPVIC